MSNVWNAELYDNKMSFVSKYGVQVLALLQAKAGERILDLGCGTGDICHELAKAGVNVKGIDFSADMIESAKMKYPELAFEVANAETYRSDEVFDAVFSNAALHWMKRPELVIQTVFAALKPGGRFVAEFGGKGNVAHVCQRIADVLKTRGLDAEERNPWYFPTIGEYTGLLEQQGFHVEYALLFERPTPQADGDEGMKHWLHSFSGPFFTDFTPEQKEQAYEQICDDLRPALFRDGTWWVDYCRLRVVARKK
ncbi:class I SAM-dependent methyltransferase [Brevibacillus fluminis]|uniref:class I SAM-dependent methyltransferase n=1 Tax=Brevibacillus fluminis TaxID=511487 RepID=UPI003F8CAB8D